MIERSVVDKLEYIMTWAL